jgi:hypothetical protein
MISIEYSEQNKRMVEVWGDRTDFDILRIQLQDLTDEENPIIYENGINEFNVFHDFIRGIRKASYGQRLVRNQSMVTYCEHEEVGFEISFYQLIFSFCCIKINASLIPHEKLLDSFLLMLEHFIIRVINLNEYIDRPEELIKAIELPPMKGNKYAEIFLNRGEKLFLEESDIKQAYNSVTALLNDSSLLSKNYTRVLNHLRKSSEESY